MEMTSLSDSLVSSFSRYRMSSSLRYTFTNLWRPPLSSTSCPSRPGYRCTNSAKTSPTVAPSADTDASPPVCWRNRVGRRTSTAMPLTTLQVGEDGAVRDAHPLDAHDLDDGVTRATAVLRRGGLVAFPTETVYGLGADATNRDALRRLYAVKGRPPSHPVIVHVGAPAAVDELTTGVPDAAY